MLSSLLSLPCFLLLQGAEAAFPVGQAALELVGFLAWFGVFGALGFHFFVLGRTAGLRPAAGAADAGIPLLADRRAARVGLAGALLLLVSLVADAAGQAAEKHLSLGAVIQRGGPRLLLPLACAVALLLCFALWRQRSAWVGAALVGLVFALRNLATVRATGKWQTLVNPLHELAASLWIGTLFVVVVAGLPAILRGGGPAGRRGPLVAELVARFSNLALVAAGLLGVTGVVTAWRHLKRWSSLWTTPYGYTLDVKLSIVLIVVALGAWNWRRMRPRLGTEEAALAIARSARAELAFAGLVLMITAVLVSLPSP